MHEAARLVTTTRVPLIDPATMLQKLCTHFAAHGEVTNAERCSRIDGRFGTVDLQATGDALLVTAASCDAERLFLVKSAIADQLVEICGEDAIDFRWLGDCSDQNRLPHFREMRVVAARQMTPSMRRITLEGDAGHFSTGGFHVRVLLPARGSAPVWPRLRANGSVEWARGDDELTGRIYTIRSIDVARGTVDVDVVLHGESPGSIWARSAKAGDPVGLMGPGGGGFVQAGSYFLCGDETALPAIARYAENLPPDARAIVRIEVANKDEQQMIASRADLDLRWLYRDGAPAGSAGLIEASIREFDWSGSPQPYLFVGCEHDEARRVRKFMRRDVRAAKDQHLVVGYWRK